MSLPESARQTLGWVLLVSIAYFSADATAAVIEEKLQVPPKALPVAAVATVAANPVAQAIPPGMVDLLATTEPDIPPPTVNPAQPGAAPSVQPVASGPPASLKLRGTMAGIGGSGLAMIDLNGETQVIGVGEEISGMRLVEVGAYTARLEGGGRSQLLEMDVVTELPAVVVPPVAATDEPIVAGASPTPAPPSDGATPAVSETPAGETGEILSQRELRNILDNPGQFAGQGFRMKPVLRDGEIVGMRVSMKDASHPLARLGVKDGDIVRSLNGQELNGPEALSSIYRVLRNTSSLKFDVERNGQNQSIDVALSE